MRVAAFLLAMASLFAAALAVDAQKSVLVTYPEDTPDSVLDQAKKAITDAGGVITHEYNLIKGFAATAGEKVLGTVAAWGEKYNALVEEDKVVKVSLQ